MQDVLPGPVAATPPSNAEGAVTAAADESPSPEPSMRPQLTPNAASATTDATITSLFILFFSTRRVLVT